MERTPVESSQLKSIGYDLEGGILEVEFKGGGVYRYSGVSPITHLELIQAGSVGKYFGQHIRGKFKTEKHEPPPAAEGASA